jgi:hypothetical protein
MLIVELQPYVKGEGVELHVGEFLPHSRKLYWGNVIIFNPKWFRLGKRQINLFNKGKYMFPEEHLEIHAEYKGVFLGEAIPNLTLGSPRMQHTSNPHGFEVWLGEGGPMR